MTTPFVGEIRLFGGNFAPAGWLFCDGSLQAIADYDTLFNLIGTTYGGDGQSTFALPDLRGRVPVHQGTSTASGSTFFVGQQGGTETVTLTVGQLPAHTHGLRVSTAGASSTSPVGGVPAAVGSDVQWGAGPSLEPMSQTTAYGGSQPHDNLQPYLGISYIISLFGIYPSAS